MNNNIEFKLTAAFNNDTHDIASFMIDPSPDNLARLPLDPAQFLLETAGVYTYMYALGCGSLSAEITVTNVATGEAVTVKHALEPDDAFEYLNTLNDRAKTLSDSVLPSPDSKADSYWLILALSASNDTPVTPLPVRVSNQYTKEEAAALAKLYVEQHYGNHSQINFIINDTPTIPDAEMLMDAQREVVAEVIHINTVFDSESM